MRFAEYAPESGIERVVKAAVQTVARPIRKSRWQKRSFCEEVHEESGEVEESVRQGEALTVGKNREGEMETSGVRTEENQEHRILNRMERSTDQTDQTSQGCWIGMTTQ
jgi:hypothetical protein